jgi:hypothetical protein
MTVRAWSDTLVRWRGDAILCTVIESPTWSYMATLHPNEHHLEFSSAVADVTVVGGSVAVSTLGSDLVATSSVAELPCGVRQSVEMPAVDARKPGALAIWSMPDRDSPAIVLVHDVVFQSDV